MSDRGWLELTVYRIGESANKPPSDTFSAHTLSVRPDGNLKIEWKAEATASLLAATIALSSRASCQRGRSNAARRSWAALLKLS